MGRSVLLLSVTLTLFSSVPGFAQWGGYGSSYAQGMARRAARAGHRMVTRHANRMIQNQRNKPKRQKMKKQDKQQQQDQPVEQKELPAQQSTGNMSPSSAYPEWPPPAEQAREVPMNPAGF
ncbi:MAG: hypothetical protein K2Y22_12765 [Candidatus Obscuribacterales bacterium]|nr:hypothetical protein [Candidatus Obscuribacterales bacterium]